MLSRPLLFLIALGLALSALPSLAQEPIPVYPGSQAEFELNLSNQDFLPVIRQVIGLAPKVLGGFIPMPQHAPDGGQSGQAMPRTESIVTMSEEIAKELQAALADVNQISVVAYRQPKDVTADKIAEFYVDKMSLTNGWTRVLAVNTQQGISAGVYARPGLTGIFAYGTGNGYVGAVKVDGKIDLMRIGEFVAKYAPMIASHAGIDMGEGPVAAPPASAEGEWEVVLVDVGMHRVRVLEAIREIARMSPAEARAFVQSLPNTLVSSVSEEEANQVKSRLEYLGAKVEIRRAD